MKKYIATLIISICAFVASGCAQVEVKDSDQLDPQQGYAVIKLDFQFGDRINSELDIELSRVDRTGVLEKIYLPKYENHVPTILRLQPGYYYLSFLAHNGGYWKERLGASATLFEVKTGVLNYAGDWHRSSSTSDTQVSGTVGDFSVSGKYHQAGWVEDNPATYRAIKSRYPGISAKLEMTFSGMVPTVRPGETADPIKRPWLELIPKP